MKPISAPVWGVLVVSGGLALLAVKTGGDYYVDFDLWMAGFWVFLPVGIASYREPGDVRQILEAALWPQVALPVAQLIEWYDTGLSAVGYFGFQYAALMALLFVLAAAAGVRLRQFRDRRRVTSDR